jgi:hypothetical protein
VITRVRLSESQQGAVQVYILDPVFDDDDICQEIRGGLSGPVLTVPRDRAETWANRIIDASNSCDACRDHHWARALAALSGKVRRSA